MSENISINDITIRSDLRPGDIGYVTYLHGVLYSREYNYSAAFESYVAKGFDEFYSQYDPEKDRFWVCEHDHRIVGFLLLMHRADQAAQLRYFILLPEYRGLGLGKRLLKKYMDFLKEANYHSSYLWTTNEQHAAATLYIRYGFILTEERESNAFGKTLTEQRYDFRSV